MHMVSIHQPEFLPWIGFFSKMARCNTFVFFDTAQYNKLDFQNRNRFGPANSWKWLTIPVEKHKHDQPLYDIVIANHIKWQSGFRNRIYDYYRKTPYFEEVVAILEPIWEVQWERLSDLNIFLIKRIADYLSFRPKFILSSNVVGDKAFFEQLSASEKNLFICKRVGAQQYLSGGYGREYLDLKSFIAEGIVVSFMEYSPLTDTPLSIIDLLFFKGKSARDEVLTFGQTCNE